MNSDCVKSWPKNERPRERLLSEGAEKVSDADLLAPPASGQCNTGRWLAGESFPRVKVRALWHRTAGISSVG
ncbi:MAG: UPF0758 domain-containing protein, partial [Kiritimatiellia bacterium]